MSQLTFLERSAERFEKVSAVVKELFKNDPDACMEALECAKEILVSTRAEVIAKAAAEVGGIDAEFRDVFALPAGDEESRRPTMTMDTREITAGNPWVHAAAFEKSLRDAQKNTTSALADFRWDAPVSLTKTEHHRAYLFEGVPFAKGEIASRLYSFLEKMRPALIGDEEKLLEKAIKASDVAAFAEISEGVFDRRGIKLPVGA
jgi:hypothetical protein